MDYNLHTLIVTTILSSLLGGGLGATIVKLLMRNEAKEALNPDLDKIEKDIERIEADFVTCKVCTATHNALSTTLKDIVHKLDLLLETALKK